MSTMNDVMGTVKNAVTDFGATMGDSMGSVTDDAKATAGKVQASAKKESKKLVNTIRDVGVAAVVNRVLHSLDLERRPSSMGRAASAFGFVAFGFAAGAVTATLVPELRDGLESFFDRARGWAADASKETGKTAKKAKKSVARAADDASDNLSEAADEMGDYARDAVNGVEKAIGRA
ncbi:MAG: hypothetical protein U0169_16110 [Polyangiaceae bacterium]